ncbi:putative cell surface glycoprotein MUC18, partial [Triplophysa rosa]
KAAKTTSSLGQWSQRVSKVIAGAPQIKDAEREIELTEKVGGWVNLTCEVRGVPRPFVTWSISGSQVVKRETEDQVYSIVVLKVSTDTLAICNSTNDFGIEIKAYNIRSMDNSGVIIVVIIVSILLLAILGSVFYFLYKKGKLPCGRSGKQEITKEKTNKDDIVVEMKANKTEDSVLLKVVNGDKKPPTDQVTMIYVEIAHCYHYSVQIHSVLCLKFHSL